MYSGLKATKRKRDGTPAAGAAAFPPQASSSSSTAPSPATTQPSLPNVRHAPKPRKWQKRTSIIVSSTVIDTHSPVPDWYTDIPTPREHGRGNAQELASIKQMIQYCIEARSRKDIKGEESSVKNVREQIHKMEFLPGLTLEAVKKSKVLEEKGLRLIFQGEYADEGLFPWDVRADAKALYRKWWRGDVDGDLMRGIEVRRNTHSTGTIRSSKTLKKGYEKKDANVVGDNGLLNGQWWPDRRCVWRDGAHGSLEAGISGDAEKGACAIVVSSNDYADRDNGEILEYCGTQSTNASPTRYTKLMQQAFATEQPIRVIRAAKKGSKYAPEMGYRYDGLYTIINEEILDSENFMARFTLRRNEGQDPIRFEGVEAKPTKYELHELMKIRDLFQG